MEVLNNYKLETLSPNIIKFYEDSFLIPNHRFLSWEHCYSHFCGLLNLDGAKVDDSVIDLAALHLGFYLASWGMYRGSTFSLQHDYKIHKDCVHILLNGNYRSLHNIDLLGYKSDFSKIELLFDLKNKINETYVDFAGKKTITDTLTTKILLGTLGCVPAYDRLFKDGLRRVGQSQTFSEGSFANFIEHLFLNKNFEILNNSIEKRATFYPSMKLIDMYYWLLGLRNKNKEFLIK